MMIATSRIAAKHRKRHNPPAALIEPFGFKRRSAHRRIMAAHHLDRENSR